MLSIITPVYNGERFIEACIRVVIDQQCPDVEHIIVDGGSSDRTVEIIEHYADQFPHIRWLSEKDQGQSDAMNKGIAMAKGEVMSFLNVDDYYEPNVLNQVVEIFKTLPEPSLLVGNCNVWSDAGELENVNKPRRLKLTDLLVGPWKNPFPANPTAYFYHTSLHQKIGPYDLHEHYAMDIDFMLKAVQAANVQYVDKTWGNHRKIAGTKTFNDLQNGQAIPRVCRLIKAYRKDLSPLQRVQVIFLYNLFRNLDRVFYFSSHPDQIFWKLKAKLTASTT